MLLRWGGSHNGAPFREICASPARIPVSPTLGRASPPRHPAGARYSGKCTSSPMVIVRPPWIAGPLRCPDRPERDVTAGPGARDGSRRSAAGVGRPRGRGKRRGRGGEAGGVGRGRRAPPPDPTGAQLSSESSRSEIELMQ
ncbi:hypothetical protein GCM10010341_54450 [Streptomyces noursei]|nr:hypothetical protein GCM10010341_54450 [Streptomyces noursei]